MTSRVWPQPRDIAQRAITKFMDRVDVGAAFGEKRDAIWQPHIHSSRGR